MGAEAPRNDLPNGSHHDPARVGRGHRLRDEVSECLVGLKRSLIGPPREPVPERLTAATMYREIGMPFWVEKAEAELTQFSQ